MAWGVERRLEFIDFRLYWEGRINRKDIEDHFGISTPQASADLRKYQEKAPKNIEYDKSQKYYYATPKFKPVFTSSSSSDYLAELRLMASGILKEDETCLGKIPNFDTIPNINRAIDPEILRKILNAINNKMSLEVMYQSMSREKPIMRKLVPHVLAYDGFRWHIRAFCYVREEIRDFLLARILEIGEMQPDEIDFSTDDSWHNYLELKIAPHPGLSETQKKIIEQDYGMENGIGTIRIRAALYFYFEKKYNLDEKCEARSPKKQHIILKNRDEIKELLDRYS